MSLWEDAAADGSITQEEEMKTEEKFDGCSD